MCPSTFQRCGLANAAVVLLQLAPLISTGVCDELSLIVQAWEARQSASTGVVVEWEERHEGVDMDWLRKHKDDAELKALAKEKGLLAVMEKAPVIKYALHKRLMMSDTCYRYSFKGEKPINGVLQPQELDTAFDGSKRIDFAAAYKRGGHPSANIYGSKKSMVPNSTYLPVVLHARPFDARLGGFSKKELSHVASRQLIDGRACTVIKSGGTTTPMTHTVWLDSSLGFVPVRVSGSVGEQLSFQLDIDYDPAGGVHPSGWRLVDNKYGGLGRSTTIAKVLAWKAAEKLDVDDFQIDLPVGTTVSDFSGESERHFVIQAETTRP